MKGIAVTFFLLFTVVGFAADVPTEGTVVGGTIIPGGPGFSTHAAPYGYGGWRSVSNIVARDALSEAYRQTGMAVYVTDEDKLFVLTGDVGSWTWVEFAKGGSLVAVTNQFVLKSGDVMSGNLDMSDNDILNVGRLEVKDLYAENETVLNIVVSNTAFVTTNLTLQGVLDMGNNQITNLTAATRGDMAVNYTQLTNAVQGTAADLYVNESGDTMSGNLTISAGGLNVSGNSQFQNQVDVSGDLSVAAGQQIRLGGPGSDTSLTYDGTTITVYKSGSAVMEFDGD